MSHKQAAFLCISYFGERPSITLGILKSKAIFIFQRIHHNLLAILCPDYFLTFSLSHCLNHVDSYYVTFG